MRPPLLILTASLMFSMVTFIGQAPAAVSDERSIIVDASAADASDANPGTDSRPLATIGQALAIARELNARSVGVRVFVHPGVYRESLVLSGDDATTSAPITLQGTGDGVIVSGADVWTGWSEAGSGLYSHPWSPRWGLAPLPAGWDGQVQDYLNQTPVIRRREMVFVDEHMLIQVMSADEAQATPDSFFVDEADGSILIHPPAGSDVTKATIEVAMRPYVLQVASMENVTIDNMTFEGGATPLPGAAVSIADSSDVSVVGSRFDFNSWTGLSLYQDERVTLRDVGADHNGVGGVTGSRIVDLQVKDSETSYNGWRGSRGWDPSDHSLAIDGNFIDFATGQKFFSLRGATFTDFQAIGNLTGGIWLDYDNADVTFDRVVLRQNLTHGLMIEASQGPISVTESEICGNETGILVNNASNVTVTGSVLAGNLIGQLFLAGANGPRPVVEFDTKSEIAVKAENWVVRGNEVGVEAGSTAIGTYLATDLWSSFVGTLESDQNHYSSPSSDDIFGMPEGITDLAHWRDATGDDEASTFTTAPGDCRLPAVTAVDTRPNSSSPPVTGTAGLGGGSRGTVTTIAYWAVAVAAVLVFIAYLALRRRGRRSRVAR
jgi:hypothetical protein